MKTKRNSPPPVTFCTQRLSLQRLFALEGKTSPEGADPFEVAKQVAPRFAFLPMPVTFEVNGDELTIKYRAESWSAEAKARLLVERAAKLAKKGDYEGAASRWCRALAKQPSLHGARRDLAHAYIKLGRFNEAKPVLLNVVWCDPDDVWALVALSAVYFRQGAYERAERFARLALALEPGNAQALSNLAAVYESKGRGIEAVETFRQAIASQPDLPHPHYGLARQMASQGRFEEAAGAIQRLFASGQARNEESVPIFDAARRLFLTCQKDLVVKNHSCAAEDISELHAETERVTGCPIRVTWEDAFPIGPWRVELAWDHGRDYHWLKCEPGYPEALRPHILAQALLRIQAQSQARRAGKRRALVISAEQSSSLLGLFSPLAARLLPDAEDHARFEAAAKEFITSLLVSLLNSAPNMLGEARIRQRFPQLRPAQLLCLSREAVYSWQARQNPARRLPMPPLLERASIALDGLNGLFLDWLSGGVMNYAARYRDLDGFDLSRKLWEHWESASAEIQPGDEYALVDTFAEILGFSGRFNWEKDPFKAGGIQPRTPHEGSGQ